MAQVDEAESAHVWDAVEVTDPVLSKQAAQLETVGYVKIRKGYAGKRPRTWLSPTAQGPRAHTAHLAALRAGTSMWGVATFLGRWVVARLAAHRSPSQIVRALSIVFPFRRLCLPHQSSA